MLSIDFLSCLTCTRIRSGLDVFAMIPILERVLESGDAASGRSSIEVSDSVAGRLNLDTVQVTGGRHKSFTHTSRLDSCYGKVRSAATSGSSEAHHPNLKPPPASPRLEPWLNNVAGWSIACSGCLLSVGNHFNSVQFPVVSAIYCRRMLGFTQVSSALTSFMKSRMAQEDEQENLMKGYKVLHLLDLVGL